ncbi:MAG: hypothetical protein LUF87_05675 [Alistipes sp.]|nr:hypothetical protein [Alistipes sp.]
MNNYYDEYGVLDMSEEAQETLELMTEKLDNDDCGPGQENDAKKCGNNEKLTGDDEKR